MTSDLQPQMPPMNTRGDLLHPFVQTMDFSPKFSVVIPLYNKAKSIRSTVESVLVQTFADFELLVVNDGSTDGSADVVRRIKDPRIRLIEKINGGVSSARNRGISEAKGEWIALLDGDDLWLPNHLENFARAIDENPLVGVFFSGWTQEKIQNFNPRKVVGMLKGEEYFKAANAGVSVWGSCVCFARKLRHCMPMFDEKLTHGEDLELWGRFAKSVGVFSLPCVTAVYRMAENMATRRCPKVERALLTYVRFEEMQEEERAFYFKLYVGFGVQLLSRFKFLELRRLLKKQNGLGLCEIIASTLKRIPRIYIGTFLRKAHIIK